MSANLKKQDIDTGDNETALDNRLSAMNPTKYQEEIIYPKNKKKKGKERRRGKYHGSDKEDKLGNC